MAFLVWKDEYLTGIEPIDAEHKKLIDLVNEFEGKCRKGEKTAAKKMFEALKRYTQEHSKKEESLMSSLRYPDFETHRSEHEKTKLKIQEAEQRFLQHGNVSSAEIKGFIIEYFYEHILVADRAFGDYVKTAVKNRPL